jgi:hypothetical protein
MWLLQPSSAVCVRHRFVGVLCRPRKAFFPCRPRVSNASTATEDSICCCTAYGDVALCAADATSSWCLVPLLVLTCADNLSSPGTRMRRDVYGHRATGGNTCNAQQFMRHGVVPPSSRVIAQSLNAGSRTGSLIVIHSAHRQPQSKRRSSLAAAQHTAGSASRRSAPPVQSYEMCTRVACSRRARPRIPHSDSARRTEFAPITYSSA